jgi:hypothetical protein
MPIPGICLSNAYLIRYSDLSPPIIPCVNPSYTSSALHPRPLPFCLLNLRYYCVTSSNNNTSEDGKKSSSSAGLEGVKQYITADIQRRPGASRPHRVDIHAILNVPLPVPTIADSSFVQVEEGRCDESWCRQWAFVGRCGRGWGCATTCQGF